MVKHLCIIITCAIMLYPLSSTCEALPRITTQDTSFIIMSSHSPILLKAIGISNNWAGDKHYIPAPYTSNDSYSYNGSSSTISDSFLISSDFVNLQQTGFNAVRYEIADDWFSENNPDREHNLKIMRSNILSLENIGMYTIICMSGLPGLDVSNYGSADMVPGTAMVNRVGYSSGPRLKSVFESDSLFKQWITAWEYVVSHVFDLDAIAGYELIYKPRLPANSERSLSDCVQRYISLYSMIRKIDPQRCILIPEFYSREANPGESVRFYDSYEECWTIITESGKEHGIIRERLCPQLPDSLKNVAYCFYLSNSTTSSAGNFWEYGMREYIHNKARWAHDQKRPVFFSEYNIDMSNSIEIRNGWCHSVQYQFDFDNISSSFDTYKQLIDYDALVMPQLNYGLWSEYSPDSNREFYIQDGDIIYKDSTFKETAVLNGVDSIIRKNFIKNGMFCKLSLMGNSSLLNQFKIYTANKTNVYKNILNKAPYITNTFKSPNTITINLLGRTTPLLQSYSESFTTHNRTAGFYLHMQKSPSIAKVQRQMICK